ncbi:TetR/AcrR family transcriptional regulator C-terminal domain-containing protein [Microtetraspora sp. AC03309]|uniref:TetR/AcrR family transcriptional regulator C-terminal domain-containing protein n=1 Tax=Microtetraspora sp. AC03309 TaxID=2779376 RepID=UPI001E2FDF57|nr:TetR/AcrR family transcriptional regulator C-terminal domain-containing protein [Microtetraspora sp. AC03309]MCC5575443.1 TetR/AcrR family transcriptional regulator C-terminal domain-containing protein [Microtetraspora sp. AC03309]
MVVFAGQGDARRSMSLLWRVPGSGAARGGRGPKPGLSVDVIVDAAIAVADADGMAALSMRAVGERLGRTGMALYTYVPNKGELVDLMYDRALAELPADYDLEAGWRPAVTSWAEDTWEFYLRHPWVLQVSQARPVLGPNEYVMLETLLAILRETGLDAAVVRRVVGTLFHFVRGAAQTVTESREAATATGVPDDEWWQTRSALLREVVPDFFTRFPMVAWLESDTAPPAEDDATPFLEREARRTFEVGLDILLDGIHAAVRRAEAAALSPAGSTAGREE